MGQPAFGAWLKRQRQALDLTQEGLARLVPCSPETIRKLEAGTRRSSCTMAERLALLLAMPVEQRDAFVQLARAYTPPPRGGAKATAVRAPLAAGPPQRTFHLPAPVTSLIGRVQETARVRHLLLRDDVRFVTVTGPPGIGKTRLGLKVATEVTHAFEHGVCFVALAPVSDPHFVLPTIVHALQVRDSASESLIEKVKFFLQNKSLLLVLDNFEHLLPASSLIGELLMAAPHLKILATSRTHLHLYGESIFPVPPLALPDLEQRTPLADLSECESVKLFVARMQAIRPDGGLTEDNRRAIAEICVRLEGLPLAIELAAGRTQLFPPHALLARLHHRLTALTEGACDLPPRHQTLRNALAWSYELLGVDEQRLFRYLGVFVGGCTEETVKEICTTNRNLRKGVVPNLLGSLMRKSLLQQTEGVDGVPRFSFLEMMREYALEQLEACGEARALRDRHLHYFLCLAEQAEQELRGPGQGMWLDRLQMEHDNLRAALGWALDRHEPDLALRMAAALFPFWIWRGRLMEGRMWLDRALASSTALRTKGRAKALRGASVILWAQGNYTRAQALQEETLALWQELGDPRGVALAFNDLGLVIMEQGDYDRATPLFEQSLALASALGDKEVIHYAFSNVGDVAHRQGDYENASTHLKKALALAKEQGDELSVAIYLIARGWVAHQQGEYRTARKFYLESLALCKHLRNEWNLCDVLEGLAGVDVAEGQVLRATRKFAAADRLREAIGASPFASEAARNKEAISIARASIGEAAFAVIWFEGRAMILEDIIANIHAE